MQTLWFVAKVLYWNKQEGNIIREKIFIIKMGPLLFMDI